MNPFIASVLLFACVSGSAFAESHKDISLKLKLLSGVRAPTDGRPVPVLFSCEDSNCGEKLGVPGGQVMIIAAAQGSLTESRALFRLSTARIKLTDGRQTTKDIDGWVVGEDGARGIAGSISDPADRAFPSTEKEFYIPKLESSDGVNWKPSPPSKSDPSDVAISIASGALGTAIVIGLDNKSRNEDAQPRATK